MARKPDKRDEYRDNVGREPRNLPDDHPDKWQWEYTGTKEERDALLERLSLQIEDEPATQEETLF